MTRSSIFILWEEANSRYTAPHHHNDADQYSRIKQGTKESDDFKGMRVDKQGAEAPDRYTYVADDT